MKKLLLLFIFIHWAQSAMAQIQQAIERFPFEENIEYDASITSPKEFLGYELGEQYTFHYQVMDYFRLLAEESEKITVHEYARTYEGRDLNYAVISSPSNMSNIESIQKANLELATTPEKASLGEQPIVVWMSYNVHGNEPSSSEAAMQTAYRLVATNDMETTNWLENAVIIIDPMINPDGRDRYIYWYKSSQANVLNEDPSDLEHDEIWPGGRTNHYWFDLNRDWVWLVHPESRGRIAVYQKWMPQVHIDFHEQGYNNNYFTMPGTTPDNHELPGDYNKWAKAFGDGAIVEFDKAQVNYFTREAFDFFYPGYGSSYPSVMGGIGMLAEQGGHSRGGRAVETNDGYVLTLRQRIFDHYKNGISIVKTSVENREGLLSYFKEARSQSTQKGDTKAYILKNNPNDYTYDVVNMLLQHNVKVHRTTEAFTQRNAYDYWEGESASREYEAGDFIIKTDQPAHLFVNTLFRRQLEIKDSVMYDMATWSVPIAYNLQEASWTTSEVKVNTEPVIKPLVTPSGVENNDAGYAYVMDWNQRNAPKALSKLWEHGYKVRSAEKTFAKNGETFSRGSIVILLGRNLEKEASVHADMKAIAEETEVVIKGFDTGRMDEGIDLASRSMAVLEAPKVALLIDQPFSSYTAGQLWFLFDHWTELKVSRIKAGSASRTDLSEYDVIIMPPFNGSLEEGLKNSLESWVKDGGTLVAAESAAAWATRSELTDAKLYKKDDGDKENDEEDGQAYMRYEDRTDARGLERIPGSAFKGLIDASHPLAFGMPNTLYSLKFGANAIEPSEEVQTVGYYVKEADDVLASGYASSENKELAAGKTFAAVDNVGRGKVVLLLDNTQYRMFWVGPARMMQNAVMLVPGF